MVDGGYWRDQLGPVLAGRRWLIATEVLAAMTGRVRLLREVGAPRPFVLAGARGTGEVPTDDEAEVFVVGTTAETMIGTIRAAEAMFDDPPPAARAAIAAWDPDGMAQVLGTIFAAGQAVCGRPYWGGRPPAWMALEDKITVDALWDAAGVTRAPSRVVAPTREALDAAAAQVDAGLGTVWSGDMREGFNGGAEYVRWVRDADGAAEAAAFFAAHCDRVRVMPFLDGIPCSIHGMVFDDTVIAFRPCEMVVLRRPDTTRFRYASAATFWEPAAADREAMRDVARRVGAHLRARVDYRGAFTVDGVMTADGFRPTELNPRVGAALLGLTRAIPQLHLALLNLAIVARAPIDWDPPRLERVILEGSEAHRSGVSAVVVERPIAVDQTVELVIDLAGARPASPGGPWDARVDLGPGPAGGFLRVTLNPELTPVGPSVAPRVAAALRWADATWDLGIGPMEPAPSRR